MVIYSYKYILYIYHYCPQSVSTALAIWCVVLLDLWLQVCFRSFDSPHGDDNISAVSLATLKAHIASSQKLVTIILLWQTLLWIIPHLPMVAKGHHGESDHP